MITKEEILKMIADQRKGWLTQIIKSYQDDIFDVPVFRPEKELETLKRLAHVIDLILK